MLKDIAAARRTLRRPVLQDAGVHDVRRRIKRARAGLRLLRVPLGPAEYRRCNAALRDVAGSLRAARDAKVLRMSAQGLARDVAGRVALRPMREQLRLEHERAMRRLSVRPRCAAAALLEVVAQRVSLRLDDQDDAGRDALRAGLRRSYDRSQRAFQAARRRASDDRWHECRKQLKYVGHELDLLAAARPVGLNGWRRRAHRMTALLGEDHDLSLLREWLMSPAVAADQVNLNNMLRIVDERRKGLQRRGVRLGTVLLERPSKAFAAHAL